MNVGIILHGKPNEGSHIAQNIIDGSLQERIVSEFFADLPHRPAVAWLIADARYWHNKWYSVYTFWCGSNGMKDTSNRNSYIALSVVLDGCYCPLVSDMYEHLKRVYETFIVGRYVAQGKYLVCDFNDTTLFQALLGGLSTGFPEAVKPFDNTFQPQANLTDGVEYNIVDCDARAFVNDWRRCGRIIVSPTVAKNSSYRDDVTRLNYELEMSKRKHREKDNKIQTLTNEKSSLQTELNRTNQSKGNLSNEINALRSQVQTLQTRCQASTDALTKIAGIVTEFATVTPPPASQPVTTSTERLWVRIKKFLDTFLLILILVVVGVFTCKAFLPDEAEQKCKDDIVALRAQVTTMNITMNQLLERVGKTGGGEGAPGATAGTEHPSPPTGSSAKNGSMDEDCTISVTQAGKPIKSGGIVDFAQPISINIGNPLQGYDIHTDNISNAAVVKNNIRNKKEVTILPVDKSKQVVIWYRSDNIANVNPNNKITLKQQ